MRETKETSLLTEIRDLLREILVLLRGVKDNAIHKKGK